MLNLEIPYYLIQKEDRIFWDRWSKSWNWPHLSKAGPLKCGPSYSLQVTSETDQLHLFLFWATGSWIQATNRGNKACTGTEDPDLLLGWVITISEKQRVAESSSSYMTFFRGATCLGQVQQSSCKRKRWRTVLRARGNIKLLQCHMRVQLWFRI